MTQIEVDVGDMNQQRGGTQVHPSFGDDVNDPVEPKHPRRVVPELEVMRRGTYSSSQEKRIVSWSVLRRGTEDILCKVFFVWRKYVRPFTFFVSVRMSNT